jgi:hypothetical protein
MLAYVACGSRPAAASTVGLAQTTFARWMFEGIE